MAARGKRLTTELTTGPGGIIGSRRWHYLPFLRPPNHLWVPQRPRIPELRCNKFSFSTPKFKFVDFAHLHKHLTLGFLQASTVTMQYEIHEKFRFMLLYTSKACEYMNDLVIQWCPVFRNVLKAWCYNQGADPNTGFPLSNNEASNLQVFNNGMHWELWNRNLCHGLWKSIGSTKTWTDLPNDTIVACPIGVTMSSLQQLLAQRKLSLCLMPMTRTRVLS